MPGIRQLFCGQKQRLSIALALVGRPEIEVLDEPTTGLEPQRGATRSTGSRTLEVRRVD